MKSKTPKPWYFFMFSSVQPSIFNLLHFLIILKGVLFQIELKYIVIYNILEHIFRKKNFLARFFFKQAMYFLHKNTF